MFLVFDARETGIPLALISHAFLPILKGGGGQLPYETDGDVRRLALGVLGKTPII